MRSDLPTARLDPPREAAPPCRLCGQALPAEGETVTAADIEALYRQDLGMDLAALGCAPPAARYHLLQCPGCRLRQFSPDWVAPPAVYRALQVHPWYYQADKSEFRAAAAQIRPGQAVLEVGCGSGKFHRFLPPRVAYLGLESNTEALAQARAQGLDVRSLDLQRLAERDPERFDVALAFQVLEHVPQPLAFLQDLARCVRPGGLVIVSVPADDSFLGREVNNVLNMPPHHCTRWPDATLARLPALLGLQAVQALNEALAPGHGRADALARVLRGVARLVGRRTPPLVMLSRQRLLRRALGAAALPLRAALRLRSAPRRGHTVTVVMRKPGSFGP
ncbi:Methyltransferase type 12 [Rubrivivax sp. A210]|uniref:class I SAM-dependent methyltransferase n=1 Tax=Rubrivivax sp. A210 TaxID=2772301 RepID=UPI001917F853|nr:class I SAM-dependent methyltransferase [Rubrivivax sp. A210]CAD5371287.1 Methyltransferase type 12 [Rubrivivax sp. A210]